MLNPYFSQSVRSEQKLYEDIVIESLKIYGQDVYYLPRDIVNENTTFGDDVPSRFNSSHKIEMYIENTEGFDGEGDLFTRFGVEIRDEATFVVSRRRWKQSVMRADNQITGERPREGDLIWLSMSKKLFQINHVEHEQPFYQLTNLPVYKMRCQLFEYSDEQIETGVADIDKIDRDNSYTYKLQLQDFDANMKPGDTITQALAGGVTITGEVSYWDNVLKRVQLIHVGADDGEFHTFTTGSISIDGPSYGEAGSNTVTSIIGEEIKSSNNEQNDGFSTFSDDFLDFTEDNPFGDPENN